MRLRWKSMLTEALLFIFLTGLVPLKAQNLETQLKQIAYNVDFAVLPVWYNAPGNQISMQVVGTAFLVTPDGYFVTAAHVVEEYKPKSDQMTVGLRQRSGDMTGLSFDLIEKDEAHDLALCKIVVPLGRFAENKDNPGTEHPVASLRVSTAEPIIGEFIAIAGFPLGSWNPAIQLGTVAAIRTINPNVGRVPAGQRDLLQISTSGNKGNSGSPVVQLDTGEVIGVIVQAEPAPLYTAVQGVPLAQSSGIMLAVPASWVGDLLKRNNVQSIAQPPPKGHTSYYQLPSK